MDIKLRARLSAFSRADAIPATINDIPTISDVEIDSLFENQTERTITKGEIDTLFLNETKVSAVDKSAIDTLFRDGEKIGIVSFASIDSLFKKE